MTLEEAQQAQDQLDALDVDDREALLQTPNNLQGVPGAQLAGKVCQLYKPVRPFLLLITSFFFIPEKWRNVIRVFTTSMDTLCPQ